ncbi:uncharacterized protein K452DRAFT_290593 [Aplosporella prunicola CBS 121167]|uniref:Uncharacterized protein n=1 Tax=Aplosporella prunicola CBS 121167 TaxID=1176127 RepID=A0A6A6B4X1_9PEZI|nr:uncharacterized protein K452DRAFT_290593 [Aplosporella prunicola CBS 121167]KAF2138453.1 hypothetical protein K452DRAFT_290593 [Aplosporella prunicola CBS 121167]
MPPWSTIVDRRTVRSLTDVAWYDLMGVLVKLKSSHEWAKHAFTLHSDNDCANTRTRAQAASPPPAPGDLVYAAIAQTAHLYIWGVLSDLKYDTASKGHFSRQLRALLSVPDLLERWTAAGARLPSLAWTLGVGWFVASGHHGDPSLPKWFEGRLAVVVPEMVRMQLVTGGPGIEVLMGEFPSTDVFWKEMWRLAERWGAMRESAV